MLDVIHEGHFLDCINNTGFEGEKKVSHETNRYVTERKQGWKARSLPLGNLDPQFNAYTFHEDLKTFIMVTLVSVVTKLPQLCTGASVAHTSEIRAPETLLLSIAGHLELQIGVAIDDDVIYV